ncbi:polysaccharide biosynthesis/export family protein [Oscillatoria amoena NRMC-F 0135]|nr:polysaccharide biosynthesis/export family protein [Oscillatoria amoena NRMC-F 0135]
MKKSLRSILVLLFPGIVLFSCASYKQNIMFKYDESTALQQQAAAAERNYIIQTNDLLKLRVYTNKGELIIDPDYNLLRELPTQTTQLRPDPSYLVDINGIAKFPMVGELKVTGLTIRQAEEILQKSYAQFYTSPFVTLTFTNKRVVVLGLPVSKVIPLENDNVSLVEAIGLAGGLDRDSKAQNIRVLRGQEFYVADLSTLEGYTRTNMILQPGDIVYIEPIRRPVSEALRDYVSLISLITSFTTLIVVISTL